MEANTFKIIPFDFKHWVRFIDAFEELLSLTKTTCFVSFIQYSIPLELSMQNREILVSWNTFWSKSLNLDVTKTSCNKDR